MDRIHIDELEDDDMIESVFPELEDKSLLKTNKWGILDVCLTKCNKVVTGYQWKYSYFDGAKIRVLSSYDLTRLRQKVMNRGLEWIITDNKLAIDSYKLNHELLEKREDMTKNHKNSTSGVKYVYRTPDKGSRRGFYWIYVNNHKEGQQKSYTSNSLLRLKERVEKEGLAWTVINTEVYEKLLSEESRILGIL